jgi:hypothetical protein
MFNYIPTSAGHVQMEKPLKLATVTIRWMLEDSSRLDRNVGQTTFLSFTCGCAPNRTSSAEFIEHVACLMPVWSAIKCKPLVSTRKLPSLGNPIELPCAEGFRVIIHGTPYHSEDVDPVRMASSRIEEMSLQWSRWTNEYNAGTIVANDKLQRPICVLVHDGERL